MGTDLEASALRDFTVLEGPTQEEKISHWSHPATNTMSSNNDCPGKICPWKQALIQPEVHEMESIPGTVIGVKNLWLNSK